FLTHHVGAARLRAAIIDHKLREGSGADARKAEDIADAAGVEAHVLELIWADSANRAHEAARALRYAALCQAARKLGARVIATGHTRDDQAETVFLRASRSSGLRGLAGMAAFAPAPSWPDGRGLWLARPLLRTRRNELRDFLATRRAAWIEDPANENEIHARVRARRALAELEREGLDPMRFASFAERLRPHVDEIDRRAAALIDDAAAFDADEVVFDRSRWRGDETVRQRALDVLITAASGAERGAPPSQLENLSEALDRSDFRGATLAGAWLQPRGGRIVIARDPGALAGRADGAAPVPPLRLAPSAEAVWDGRVLLRTDEPGWSVVFNGRSPELQRGEERRPLAAASPHWLLRERVQHLLGGINTGKSR
ncbi:MAG TPA: tRNA lysidine(34) synthetase TilS, partial [Candidatus Binatia bacterium]|nr:tRNA lysidine(34) synthetase TilS [Candidatus Binatia bacterium]